ncbi:hypothetical protein D9M68_945960 [compost metagenome]
MIITAARTTEALGASPRTQSSVRVDISGVRKLNTPICRASPRLSAASHRKNAPPSGPRPSRAIRPQSRAVSAVAGSSQAWHSSESSPETSAKLPMAAVGNARTRFVSSE